MHKILLILLLLQVSLIFGAQFDIVSEIEEDPLHMGLMQMADNDKLDNNGELGALLIVNCGIQDLFFKNMVSKISQIDKSGAYWVVMKQRAQYFVLSKEGFANYRYDFPTPLVSGAVYKMTIDELNKQAATVTLVITSNQDKASVYVKGELIGKTENKLLTIDLPLGNNEIEVRKSGFKSKSITHNLSPENNKVEINLQAVLPTAVTITTEPEGASVYIDNVLFGTSPKSSFFDEGTYPIKIEKESYATINEEITIKEPETKKHFKLKDIRATLTIKTNPGATVILNGTSYKGGLKDQKLNPQTINIKVEEEFCETISESYTLKENEVKVFDLYPKDIRATITIKTNSEAIVTLNGIQYKGGLKDQKLNPQTVNIKVEEEFCETISESYTLKKNEVKVWELYPQNISGTITINTNPKAEVLINGKSFTGSIQKKKYLPGNISIKVTQDFCETINESYSLSSNEDKIFDLYPQNISGSVTINTNPQAKVIINGEVYTGSVKNKKYLPGQISLTVTQEFCETIKDNFILNSNEDKIVDLFPKDISGYVTIKTNPQAKIFINNKEYQEVNKLRMIPQVLEIKIQQAKADDIEKVVTLKAGDDNTLELLPEINKSRIDIVVIPTTASIELKGDAGEHYTAIGRKSFTDIPIGTYDLTISNDGYKTHKEAIKLTADDMVQKQISLEEGSDIPDTFVFVQGGTVNIWIYEVTVSDFYIGKYEVTQAEWQEVMGSNPSNFKGDNKPVEQVTWYDAVEFCNKKSRKEGLEEVYSGSGPNIKCDFSKNGYRLPTEAEWEFAAKGGNKSKDYTYSGSNNIAEIAWYVGNSNKSTKHVGGKKPNELGIYDMSGNVYEWCWDWYGSYSSNSQSNPVEPPWDSSRMLFGGSWSSSAYDCQVVNRDFIKPFREDSGIGFRLARSSE